jgi:FlaG/FlaF family flagellin (archaellin)
MRITAGWASWIRRAVVASAMAIVASAALPGSASAAPEVTEQEGYALECTGEGGGYTASVSLYQNSILDAPVTSVTITTDGTELGGQGTTTGDVFDDGTIDVEFALINLETRDPAGSATVTGTYEVTGSPTRVHEAIRDNGYIVVSTGTNTALSTDLELVFAGTTIALTCEPAFAFELTTRQQPIGNR